ncbi:MAG: hypothetical protein QXS11_02225 [Zestosphaera sp.]
MVSMEVIIALIAGILVGTLLGRALSNKEKNLLTNIVSKTTLFLTYALVFVIGLRISQILPDIITRGQQVVLVVIAFSTIPAVLSLAISYLTLRS